MKSPALRYIILINIGIVVLLALFKYVLIENAIFDNPLPGEPASLYQQFTEDTIHVDHTEFEALLDGRGPYYLAADHPKLIQYVRDNVLIPPSTLPYNLTHPETKNSSPEGQIKRALSILKNKKNGFFIEAGALTGEFWSDSLSLERFYDWTGLLVEASPTSFKELKTKNRKAWSANCCLSPKPYPIKVTFDPSYATGQIVDTDTSKVKSGQVVVQCFPLQTLLLAINQTHVDYCSLDIQGSEMDVIKTLPLDTIDIKVFSIEHVLIIGGKPVISGYMKTQGYTFHSTVNIDMFFVKH
ncbi:unnamed protein product [Meganyctiphanes norvegica]|uniref:Methyltransferase FkbM domain-containing protein n=1 Tax=Meganyctiphanes norvegica TaxID=48144 RepID=A0AAV2RMQ4_MEGNR